MRKINFFFKFLLGIPTILFFYIYYYIEYCKWFKLYKEHRAISVRFFSRRYHSRCVEAIFSHERNAEN